MAIQKPIEVAGAFQFSKILLWAKPVTTVTRRVHSRPLVLSVLFTLRRQDSWCFPLNIEFNWRIVVRVAYRCKASLLLSLLLSYALPPLAYLVSALEFYPWGSASRLWFTLRPSLSSVLSSLGSKRTWHIWFVHDVQHGTNVSQCLVVFVLFLNHGFVVLEFPNYRTLSPNTPHNFPFCFNLFLSLTQTWHLCAVSKNF